MSLLAPFLIATTLIAGFILLRMFADRSALRTKIPGARADSECEQAGCFRACDPDSNTAGNDPGNEENAAKRSAYRAP